jgi:hypothetical protein
MAVDGAIATENEGGIKLFRIIQIFLDPNIAVSVEEWLYGLGRDVRAKQCDDDHSGS